MGHRKKEVEETTAEVGHIESGEDPSDRRVILRSFEGERGQLNLNQIICNGREGIPGAGRGSCPPPPDLGKTPFYMAAMSTFQYKCIAWQWMFFIHKNYHLQKNSDNPPILQISGKYFLPNTITFPLDSLLQRMIPPQFMV